MTVTDHMNEIITLCTYMYYVYMKEMPKYRLQR